MKSYYVTIREINNNKPQPLWQAVVAGAIILALVTATIGRR